jgi:hypothetical protein
MSRRPLSFWSAADLLDPEPLPPVAFEPPRRASTLRGKVIRRREPRPLASSADEIAAMVAAARCEDCDE